MRDMVREMVFLLQLIILASTIVGASCKVGGIYIYSSGHLDTCIFSCHVGEAAYNGNVNAIKLPPNRLF